MRNAIYPPEPVSCPPEPRESYDDKAEAEVRAWPRPAADAGGGVSDTLRTNEEVLAVLRAGGYAVTLGQIGQVGYGLATLYDASGAHVRAWQNAIKANLGTRRCTLEIDSTGARTHYIWRLKP